MIELDESGRTSFICNYCKIDPFLEYKDMLESSKRALDCGIVK
jgi:hypothetical protein